MRQKLYDKSVNKQHNIPMHINICVDSMSVSCASSGIWFVKCNGGHMHTFETPIIVGIILSMSAHLYVKACFSPVSRLMVCSTWSKALN